MRDSISRGSGMIRSRATASNSNGRSTNNNKNNNISSGYDYVEDYGESQQAAQAEIKSRGTGSIGGAVLAPILFLNKCRRILFNPATICAIAIFSSFITIQFVNYDDNGSNYWSFITTIASGLTITIALLVLLQQRKLRKIHGLRREHNDLRRKTNYFKQEREKLHRTMDRLDMKMSDLQYVPKQLYKITKNNTVNVDQLIQLIKEKHEIQNQIKHKLQQQIMQQTLGVVVKADKDMNWSLQPKEVDILITRLNMVDGIELNEKRLREMLRKDPSIHSIFQLLRSLKENDDEYVHGEAVFIIKPESMLSGQKNQHETGT